MALITVPVVGLSRLPTSRMIRPTFVKLTVTAILVPKVPSSPRLKSRERSATTTGSTMQILVPTTVPNIATNLPRNVLTCSHSIPSLNRQLTKFT